MRINVKHGVLIGVLSLGVAIARTPPVTASTSSQEHHEQDYSKNKNYQLGMRDGKDDSAHNRDHYKKRKFKKDDDRNAYEAGYQSGHRGPDHH
jgi:hypothetical protein